jgi:hypothetical protein
MDSLLAKEYPEEEDSDATLCLSRWTPWTNFIESEVLDPRFDMTGLLMICEGCFFCGNGEADGSG